MLMALLSGKLSSEVWLGSEDLLTSAVFGTLKNLPASVTVELLARARALEGPASPVLAPPLAWSFWPSWRRCEPDVVIEDGANLCVVEAKLYSDFGKEATAGHQLLREWRDGVWHAQRAGKELWLIAVTNHAVLPAEAIRAQLAGGRADPTHVCWLSWLEVAPLLAGVRDDLLRGWCDDLLALLRRMGLVPCEGFHAVFAGLRAVHIEGVPWLSPLPLRSKPDSPGFRRALESAVCASRDLPIDWRLGANLTYG